METAHYRRTVAAELDRLAHDQTVVVRLRRLRDLVEEPSADPWRPDLAAGSGAAAAVAVLTAARHLPPRLVLRAEVDEPRVDEDEHARVAEGLHRLADARAAGAWREAMVVRSDGRRQMPMSLGVAFLAAFLAYGLGYLASQQGVTVLGVVLVVLAGLSMTVAWVTSWMVMEYALYDWRDAARRARAYDLVARAELVVVPTPAPLPATRPTQAAA